MMNSIKKSVGWAVVQVGRRPYTMAARPTVADLLKIAKGEKREGIAVYGYVKSLRKYKTEQFVDITDGSSLKPLQAVMPRELNSNLHFGSAIKLVGNLVPCEDQTQQSHELKVTAVELLGPTTTKTYPIQKKYQSMEYLRTIPHLRSRIPLNAAQLRLRSAAITAIQTHFTANGYIQTHPPLITSSDCEGAGEVFTVVSGTPEEQAKPKTKPSSHFFRDPKYLTVSTQLHLEALAQSVGPVWTLSPTFRAEQSDTSRHMSEFYMLEAEVPFVSDISEVMDVLENLLRATATTLYDTSAAQDLITAVNNLRAEEPDLASRDKLEKRWKGMSAVSPAWPRITYTKAVTLLQAAEKEMPGVFKIKAPAWGDSLASEHEKWLASTVSAARNPGWQTPIFITHYPEEQKAFYMLTSSPLTLSTLSTPNKTVDCFDLLVPDICELSGGSMREHEVNALINKMKARGMEVTDGKEDTRSTAGLDWYVNLRRWGCPPHGGFGVGFDRLLSYLSGVPNVKDVVAFPRWYGRCDC